MIRTHAFLVGLLCFAFALRLAGVSYGLPLLVVNDEPPFVLGALKMLQLKTLIPSLHPEEFGSILYYPPYLSYLYLIPFALFAGVKLLLWDGARELFLASLGSDLSGFFVIARLLSVCFGVGTIALVYHASLALFKNRTAAFGSAFLLSTSLPHIGLSMVARQWTPIAFLFTLILFILTRSSLPLTKRYAYSVLVAGVGIGFSSLLVLGLVLPLLWHIFLERTPVRELWRSRFLKSALAICVLLAIIPSFLNANSQGFLVDLTLLSQKSLSVIALAPFYAIDLLLPGEGVLVFLFLLGSILLWRYRALFYFFTLFILSYIFIFILLFRLESRFLLPLLSFLSLVGGLAIAQMWAWRFGKYIVILLLLFPLVTSLRLATLAMKEDTRIAAMRWVEAELSPATKVLTYANLFSLPQTGDSLVALREIDPGAVRFSDEAQARLLLGIPHALNLYAVSNASFWADVHNYARGEGYTHLVVDWRYNAKRYPERLQQLRLLVDEATPLWHAEGIAGHEIASSEFEGSISSLWKGTQLGPSIFIYTIK